MPEDDDETKLDKYGPYISWLVGGFFALFALTYILAGGGIVEIIRNLIGGLIALAVAIILIPPSRRHIEDRVNRKLTRRVLVIIAVVGLIAVLGAVPPTDDQNGGGTADTPTPTPTAMLTPTPTPTATDTATTPEATVSATPSPQPNVQQAASDSYGTSGLGTDVSATGSIILFGFDDGNVMIYDDTRSGEVIPLGIDRITQIEINEDANRAAIASEDAESYAIVDLDENDGPAVRHPALWDIDMAADGATVASVSQPNEGRGSVGLSVNGEIQWETQFEDSAGWSVAISEDANHVAVGATKYWDGTETTGTSGVKLFDADGNELWTYETETDVISVNIDADRELVVAGTDAGNTIVLDFDGNVVWETTEFGGYVTLSGDGSTVVTAEGAGLLAVDAETGDEMWQADKGGLAFDQVSVSHDGNRALAAHMNAGEVFVIEEGTLIWKASYEVGPAVGALSGDGATWSVIVQNNDERTAEVEIYDDK
jgi:hypothetical protein